MPILALTEVPVKWKDAAFGYMIGRTAESGLKAALGRLAESGQSKYLRDDEIPAMRLLNRGRNLLREGKKKEAIELDSVRR